MGESVTMASLGGLATDVGTALTWFFSIFGNLIDTISQNNILLWSVILAIVSGALFFGVKLLRKFGLKGRR